MFRISPWYRLFPTNNLYNNVVCLCVNNFSASSAVFSKSLNERFQNLSLSPITPHRELLENYFSSYKLCVRLKSSKGSKTKKNTSEDLDDDDDETSEFDDGDKSLSRDSKIMALKVTSLRNDAILKSALNIARNKVEVLFYESKIRLNGKKLVKRSYSIKPGDEIDIIKGISVHNKNHLYVSRVQILKITGEEEHILVNLRRFKSLLIDNYDDKWEPGSNESS